MTVDQFPMPRPEEMITHMCNLHGYTNPSLLAKLHPDDVAEEHQHLHDGENIVSGIMLNHAHVPTESVQKRATEAVQTAGGCGLLSPDHHQACILNPGHTGPHGWEVRFADWLQDALTHAFPNMLGPQQLEFVCHRIEHVLRKNPHMVRELCE